jgi:hypothetical protein
MPKLVGGEKARFEYLMCKLMTNSVARNQGEERYTMLRVNCRFVKAGAAIPEFDTKIMDVSHLYFEVIDMGYKMTKEYTRNAFKPLTEIS